MLVAAIFLITAQNTKPNYAEDVAKPIEQALIKAGLAKVASSGDAGYGADNDEPWYDARFSSRLTKKEAVELISKVANDNGYVLQRASPENRGHLGAVADKFISNWYYDNTSKSADYPNVPHDPIKLGMAIDASKPDVTDEMANVEIRLTVTLPQLTR